MYSLTCGTFIGLFTMPVVGVLLDKLSVRKLFAAGIVLFALGLWLLGQTTTISQYIVVFGITMALANALAGAMISSAVVSRWFSENRGKALGVAATGTSVGGVLVPWLITFWLPDYGWRGTLENLAIVLIVLVLPVVVWTIRNWPPEVERPAAEEGEGTGSPRGPAWPQRYPAQSKFLVAGCVSGAPFQYLYLDPVQHDALRHTTWPPGGGSFRAYYGSCDQWSARQAAIWRGRGHAQSQIGAVGAQLLLAAGFILLALEPSYPLIMLACVSIGLAAGGMLPVWGAFTRISLACKATVVLSG